MVPSVRARAAQRLLPVRSDCFLLPPTRVVPNSTSYIPFQKLHLQKSLLHHEFKSYFLLKWISLYYPNWIMLGFTPSQLLKEQYQNNIFWSLCYFSLGRARRTAPPSHHFCFGAVSLLMQAKLELAVILLLQSPNSCIIGMSKYAWL